MLIILDYSLKVYWSDMSADLFFVYSLRPLNPHPRHAESFYMVDWWLRLEGSLNATFSHSMLQPLELL